MGSTIRASYQKQIELLQRRFWVRLIRRAINIFGVFTAATRSHKPVAETADDAYSPQCRIVAMNKSW